MLISLSAKPKIESFQWYRFDGKRTVRFEDAHKSYNLEIEAKEIFGIRRGKSVDTVSVLHEDAPNILFNVNMKAMKRVIEKSVGYSGKVGNVRRVTAGKLGKDKKNSKPIPVKTNAAHAVPIETDLPIEDVKLTGFLKKIKFPGMRNVKHLMAQYNEEKELLQYYDVSNALVNYRRKNRLKANDYGNFAYDLSLTVEKALRNAYVEVGTVRFDGKLLQVMVIVED